MTVVNCFAGSRASDLADQLHQSTFCTCCQRVQAYTANAALFEAANAKLCSRHASQVIAYLILLLTEAPAGLGVLLIKLCENPTLGSYVLYAEQ